MSIIEFIDESEIKKDSTRKSDMNISNEDKIVKKIKLELISKDDIIECERRQLGIVNNCAICEVLNKEIFGRCKNRYLEIREE